MPFAFHVVASVPELAKGVGHLAERTGRMRVRSAAALPHFLAVGVSLAAAGKPEIAVEEVTLDNG